MTFVSQRWQALHSWFDNVPTTDRLPMLLAALCGTAYLAYLLALVSLLNRPIEIAGDKLRIYILAVVVIGIALPLACVVQLIKNRQAAAGNHTFYERLLLFNACFLAASVLGMYGINQGFLNPFCFFLAVGWPIANGILIAGQAAIYQLVPIAARPRWVAGLFAGAALLIVLVGAGIWLGEAVPGQGHIEPAPVALTLVACAALIIMPAALYRYAYQAIPWIAVLTLPLFAGGGFESARPMIGGAVVVTAGLALLPRLWAKQGQRSQRALALVDALAMAWIAVMALDINFLNDRFHYNAYLAPANDILRGKTALIDTFPQYGVLQTYFLAIVFGTGLVPLTYPGLSLIISVLVIVQFWLAYYLMTLATRSRWLAFAATTLMIAVMILDVPYPPTRFPAFGPFRFMFLYVILALVALRLNNPQHKRIAAVAELVVIGISAVWNTDSLIYTSAAYASLRLFEVLCAERSVAAVVRKSLMRLLSIAVSAATALAATSILVFLQAGEWPIWQYYRDLYSFIGEMQRGNAFGYYLVPTLWEPWILVAGLYIVSCVALLFKLLFASGKPLPAEVIVAFGMTIGGMVHFTNWVANSVYLYNQLIPAVFLAVFWLIYLTRAKSPPHGWFERPAKAAGFVVVAILLASFASSPYLPRRETPVTLELRRAASLISLPPVRVWNFTERWNMPPDFFYSVLGRIPNDVVPDALEAIVRFSPDQDRIALFLEPNDSVEVLVRAGKTHIFPIGDFVTTSKSPIVIALAVSGDYRLKTGDILFLDQRFPGFSAIETAILSNVCRQFDLSVVHAWPSGVTVMRLQPAGDPAADCTCDGTSLSCSGSARQTP